MHLFFYHLKHYLFFLTANPGSHEDIQRVDEKVLAFMHKLMCKDERMKTTGSNAVTFQGMII